MTLFMDNDFFDALIFDMDGTLWDATATYAEEWNETARRMGVPDFHITPEQLHQYMGLSIDKIFNAILSKCTLDPVEFCRVVDGVEDEMLPVMGGIPYPGMVDGIRRLSSRYRLFMVSNCGAGGLKSFMRFNNLTDCFTDSLTFGETGWQKAENIKALVERNGIAHPLYIGDTQGDCDEAHRAGVPFAFAAYGFGSCSNPDLLFDSFNTIVDYFMNIKEK